MESYARFLVRRAGWVLLAVALVSIWIGLGIRQLRTEFSIESSLPAHHPLIEIDRQIRAKFGGRNTIIGLIVPRQGEELSIFVGLDPSGRAGETSRKRKRG